jgi:GNAT superfamily N-acetyltransferase
VSAITFRTIGPGEAAAAAEVLFVALYDVALRHGARPVVADVDDARGYVDHLMNFDPLSGVLGEQDGQAVAVGWLHPRGSVATIGPLAVLPALQGQGLGRHLLTHLAEAAGRRVSQIRLVQDAFDTTSMGLYLQAGFRVVAPLLELELPARGVAPSLDDGTELCLDDGTELRPMESADRRVVIERDARVFGQQRVQDVDVFLERGHGVVAERGGRITGYGFAIEVGGLVQLGPAAADDPLVVRAALAWLAATLAVRGLPSRLMVAAGDRRLVDGLLEAGFRVFRVCSYMIRGGGTAPPASYVFMSGDLC